MALPDEALIDMVRVGDARKRDAFDVLVSRHQAWLVRILSYILGDQALGEDVAQETMVKAYSGLCAGEQPKTLRAWLRTIGTRLAFNRRRDRQTRERYHQVASGREHAIGLEERFASSEAVELALRELPYAYAEILVLRYVEELEVMEIASLLELGESAAKMRLKRARDALKEAISGGLS